MIENKYELVTVTESRKVGEVCRCDVCKRVIYDLDSTAKGLYRDFVGYWELITGHNDWGNDSCESREHFDLCSEECVKVKLIEYLERSNGVYNTEYFELEHTRGVKG